MSFCLKINTSDQKIIKIELEKEGKIIDRQVQENRYGSQVLLSSIVYLLKKNNLQFSSLKAVVVKEGPGSFTGLRVGVSVAQALGFALNIPVNQLLNKPLNLRYT